MSFLIYNRDVHPFETDAKRRHFSSLTFFFYTLGD